VWPIDSVSRRFVGWATALAALLVPLPVGAQISGVARVSAPPQAPQTKAVMPGFETLDDGATQLFVDLSGPVSYEVESTMRSITYILKRTSVSRRNNCNPLVTEFFNTPVTKARLAPHGRDLWFVVDVRASVEPSVSVEQKTEGGARLSIRFPKGDYLPPTAAEEPTPAFVELGSMAPSSTTSAPQALPTSHSHTGATGGHSHKHGGSTPTN
jgi:hypothetical protein